MTISSKPQSHMTDPTQGGCSFEPENEKPSPTARALSPFIYLLIAIVLPICAIPAFILLGGTDYFLHHGASIWVQSNDAVFDMRNRNCEVLIFGDSTAMTGINPELVQQRTGLKTCNIAVTNAVLSVTDRLALDHYLANNAQPHVMVVQLSPEGFEQTSREWKRTIYAEGLLELIRHAPPHEWTHILLQHPAEAVSFAGYTAGFSAYYSLKRALFYAARIRSGEDTIQVRNGFFTPPAPPRTRCDESPAAQQQGLADASREVVQGYKQYEPQHGTVLVNVAPIPACDRNLQAYQHEFSGITNNALQALPIHLFNDQRHFTASGSDVVSRMVADEVNRVTGNRPPGEHIASAGSDSTPVRSGASRHAAEIAR